MEIPRHAWEWEQETRARCDGQEARRLVRICSCGTTYEPIQVSRYKWLGCPVGRAEKEARRKAKVARKARERAAARAAAGCYSI